MSSDTPDSVCAIHNSGDAVNSLQKCCGTAPVQQTPNNCLKYCQYDSSKMSEFVACLGTGIIEAECQEAKAPTTTLSPMTLSPTKTQLAATTTYSGSASRQRNWSKFGIALAVM